MMQYRNLSEKHQFALYVHNVSSLVQKIGQGQSLVLTDSDSIHRIMVILRLTVGESLVLFDQKNHAQVTIAQLVKNKSVHVILDEKQSNAIYKSQLTFLLPVLKKEALETAICSLTQIGVTTIQLINTNKSQQRWTTKEQERVQKILIAAAEQSKNFAFPTLLEPIPFNKIPSILIKDSVKLFFDPAGKPLATCLKEISATTANNFVLAIGPEGDLTAQEKALVHEIGFTFCALTPTILRACQAAALAAGIVRSLF